MASIARETETEAAFRRAYELDGGRTEAIRWNLASALEWLGSREADFLFSDPEALHDEDATSASDDAILVAGEVQAPVKLSDAPVEYTDRARYQRVEGVVVLQTIINTAGDVTRVKVMKGLPGCTMQAIRSVRQWKFKPATLHGEPVPVYFNLTVNFQLQR